MADARILFERISDYSPPSFSLGCGLNIEEPMELQEPVDVKKGESDNSVDEVITSCSLSSVCMIDEQINNHMGDIPTRTTTFCIANTGCRLSQV